MWPSQQITSLYKQREFWQILVSYFISQCFVIIWSGSEMYGKYAAGRSLIRNMSPESESRPHDLYLWVLSCLAPGQTASELHIRKEGNVLLSVCQWEGAGWGTCAVRIGPRHCHCPVFIMAGKSHETGSENPNNSSAESDTTTQNCRYVGPGWNVYRKWLETCL